MTFEAGTHLEYDGLTNFTTQSNMDSYDTTAIPDNATDYHVVQQHRLINKVLEQYLLPVICLFGIIANTVSSVVFLQKSLRTSSCSIFLAARGISDNGFLSTLLVVWVSSTFDLKLSQIRGICQILVFLTYVCGCISVWLVVFVTAENYVRICKPFIVNRVCKTSTAKIVLLVLCVIVLCLYNFPFWTTNSDCSPSELHYKTIQAMVYLDTVLTLVFPTLCISMLLFVIVVNVIRAYNRRGRLSAPNVKRVKNPMAKVTKMLFAVTITFFCMNFPSHVIRLRLMIVSVLNGHAEVSQLEATIQKITYFIYYLSLSINFIVYFTFGSKFRKVFKETFSVFACEVSSENSCAFQKQSSVQFMLSERSVTVVCDKDAAQEMQPLNKSHSL